MSIDDVTMITRDFVYYLHNRGTGTIGFTDCRSDSQYLSDHHIHSGTDSYVRAQSPFHICDTHPFGTLDAKQHGRIYGAAVG